MKEKDLLCKVRREVCPVLSPVVADVELDSKDIRVA